MGNVDASNSTGDDFTNVKGGHGFELVFTNHAKQSTSACSRCAWRASRPPNVETVLKNGKVFLDEDVLRVSFLYEYNICIKRKGLQGV